MGFWHLISTDDFCLLVAAVWPKLCALFCWVRGSNIELGSLFLLQFYRTRRLCYDSFFVLPSNIFVTVASDLE